MCVQEKYLNIKGEFHVEIFSLVMKKVKFDFRKKLTAGITSAGFRRFFRRQNSKNTTKIKIIITNETDATIILSTGLVSEMDIQQKQQQNDIKFDINHELIFE